MHHQAHIHQQHAIWGKPAETTTGQRSTVIHPTHNTQPSTLSPPPPHAHTHLRLRCCAVAPTGTGAGASSPIKSIHGIGPGQGGRTTTILLTAAAPCPPVSACSGGEGAVPHAASGNNQQPGCTPMTTTETGGTWDHATASRPPPTHTHGPPPLHKDAQRRQPIAHVCFHYAATHPVASRIISHTGHHHLRLYNKYTRAQAVQAVQ